MHIGFITPEYLHPELANSGGLGTSIKNLAESLLKKNVEVTIFVVGTKSSENFVENRINFHFIKKYKISGFTWFLTRKYYQKEISRIAKLKEIDLLEAPDWTGITAFMKFNIPLVVRLHGCDAYFCELEGRKQKQKNYWFEKLALSSSNAIIAVSSFAGSLTKTIFSLDKPIHTIYNGVDINSFKPFNISIEKNTILYFGTIIRKKGVFELAKAFNIVKLQNPKAILKLVGKDSEDIFKGVSSLDLFYELVEPEFLKDIIYHPHMNYEEIKLAISKASVVVLPSFAEAFPMTWLEAMAMEKALVTSNIGWAKEMMIDGKTGFTIDPKDYVLYANKIVKLMNENHLNEQMGKAARKQVLSKFSTDVVVLQNIEFYRKVILDFKV